MSLLGLNDVAYYLKEGVVVVGLTPLVFIDFTIEHIAPTGTAASAVLEHVTSTVFSTVQDDFLDVLYWLRQGLCLVLGLVWGFIPLQGYVGMTL